MSVEITIQGDKINVHSPYNPDFPHAAKRLGGRWVSASKAWVFDGRDEDRVRALCLEVYGDDGRGEAQLVTIRATYAADDYDSDLAFYVAGRQVARAFDRDGGARLGEGVIVLSGGFGSSGSRKNPNVTVSAGTVIEVRDVPIAAAKAAVERAEPFVEIVEADAIDRPALEAERSRLAARIVEIDALLA